MYGTTNSVNQNNCHSFTHKLAARDTLPNGSSFKPGFKSAFPALEGLCCNRLTLMEGTMNPPHWHPKSNELVYLISGTLLFGIRGLSGRQSTFKVNAGEFVFIEQNFMHYFKALEDNVEVAVWLNSPSPEFLPLLNPLGLLPRSIVGQAFGVQNVGNVPSHQGALLAGTVSDEERNATEQSLFKFNLRDNEMSDVIAFDDPALGTVKIVTPSIFPTLKDFTFAHAILKPNVMRQIHWHQHANELSLVVRGEGQFGMTTTDSTGFVDYVGPDHLMMQPIGYPHYLKNTSYNEDLEFLLGFDHGSIAGLDPRDVLQAMSDSIREQVLGPKVPFDEFDTNPIALLDVPT